MVSPAELETEDLLLSIYLGTGGEVHCWKHYTTPSSCHELCIVQLCPEIFIHPLLKQTPGFIHLRVPLLYSYWNKTPIKPGRDLQAQVFTDFIAQEAQQVSNSHSDSCTSISQYLGHTVTGPDS